MRDGRLSANDQYLFNEGTHSHLYDVLGAHRVSGEGTDGVAFSVWAPAAKAVSVLHNNNGWTSGADLLAPTGGSGIWSGVLSGVRLGDAYKYAIETGDGQVIEKADPLAAAAEHPPATASRVWWSDYEWGDGGWMADRVDRQGPDRSVAIYEMHLGSWKRVPEEGNRWLTYRELAETLPDHLEAIGFNFVEFMPIAEYPYDPSWGYQTTGYFAPTSRFGSPDDLKFLIDTLHRRGIGVILDWVPSHFPTDGHGLSRFDGTALYEHADERQGFHPDWKTAIFNYSRHEVRSFLLSSAASWLDRFHFDGLRVDAVASMLYLDYSREEGEWIPNEHGGNENLGAIAFLRQLNDMVHDRFPGVATYAEESTAWQGVTAQTSEGGLGFDLKWDMGWMHDTLAYLAQDPVHRRHHHDELTFRSIYANSERFTLPLSHDEVVHEKRSLVYKMPGDRWQQFANLRLLLGYMYALPGFKLLFMGGELAQSEEWDHDGSLDWNLLDYAEHAGVMSLVGDLGRIYSDTPALQGSSEGFRWVVGDDQENSVYAFLRGDEAQHPVLVVMNATPVTRHGYRVGVPRDGHWQELVNTDAESYGGSGVGNLGGQSTEAIGSHGFEQSLVLSLAPLAVVMLTPANQDQ